MFAMKSLKLVSYRAVVLSLSLLLTAGGPATGLLRALLATSSPFCEQSENRTNDCEEKSKTAPRRICLRVGGVAQSAPKWSARDRSHSRPTRPIAPLLTCSEEDAWNGIGAPLRC